MISDLTHQDWFCKASSQKIMDVLAQNGQGARFVGGCVRDGLLGRPVLDIDIATPEKPDVVLELLERSAIKAIPTGIEHGTVTALLDGQSYEITTLRSDVSTDGRRATVAFSQDWIEDAKRRDFTFNALSMGRDGVLHDPFGGLNDLQAGVVRFVGDAEERIREDYLRILRFFRFYAYFGKGSPDREGLSACKVHASGIKNLSGERITQELLKLLVAPRPIKAIQHMISSDVLGQVLPLVEDPLYLEMLCAFEDQADAIRRLACLVSPNEDMLSTLSKTLRLSNKQAVRLMKARSLKYQLPDSFEPNILRGYLYDYGAECLRDRLYIYWAEKGFSGLGPREMSLLSLIDDWEKAPAIFPLSGQDMLDKGYKPGPDMGQVLKRIERRWVERGCLEDKAACLSQIP